MLPQIIKVFQRSIGNQNFKTKISTDDLQKCLRILRLSDNNSQIDQRKIKLAYYSLAKLYHPDAQGLSDSA